MLIVFFLLPLIQRNDMYAAMPLVKVKLASSPEIEGESLKLVQYLEVSANNATEACCKCTLGHRRIEFSDFGHFRTWFVLQNFTRSSKNTI